MFMNIFYVFANISSYNYFVLFLFIKKFIVVIKESKEIILVQLSFIIPTDSYTAIWFHHRLDWSLPIRKQDQHLEFL